MRSIYLLAPLALFFTADMPAPVQAHPGGLNAEGCHNNRKTGGYHCHRSQSAPPARASRSGGGSVYFANCSEARAAGYSNLRRGQPGYRPALDRDNDGIACES